MTAPAPVGPPAGGAHDLFRGAIPTPLRILQSLTMRRQRRVLQGLDLGDVVRGAALGGREHHGELCRRVHGWLLPYARHLTRDADAAEDLLQEVYASLPAQLARYDERGQFEPWLRRVTFNRWRTRDRSVRRRAEEPLDAAGEPPAAGRTITGELAARDLIDRAIQGMPSAPREAWALYSEGASPDDIALRLGISYDAANTRLTRARKYLVQRLEHLL